MKTAIVVVVLGVIGYFAFRSLYRTLTGKQGCGCSSAKKGKCPISDKCDSSKKK